MDTPRPIRVGVSACLLGQELRWDGGHKHDRYLSDILGRHFELVPVCPEVELGMGVPREPVRLAGEAEAPRMVGRKSGEDWTERMSAWSAQRVDALEAEDLSGYVLKRASPSCGMERVKVWSDKPGPPRKAGVGLYARALMARYPLLPVEEEGRLNDPALRENFIVRVFAHHRLRALFRGRLLRGDVVAFHAREKFLLLAHSPKHYRELGPLVAAIKDLAPEDFRQRYTTLFLTALAHKATPRKNVNVLQHLLGFLRDRIGAAERADILRVIESYQAGLVPLIVPVTLLNHHIQVQGLDYLQAQSYLQPAPAELALRNHV